MAGEAPTIDIRTVSETHSTNADMLALAREGAAEGLWLRAESQSAGRGRLARSWESPQGNLHCSTLVRLSAGDPPAPTLALVAAVATWEAIDALLPGRACIKWPNDIMAGTAKLSGMLLERTGDAIIVGIGVNIRAHPELPDRPTTSLWVLGAVESDAASLLESLAARFAQRLHDWRTYGIEAVRHRWLAAAHPVGTPLRASLPDGSAVEGRFATLDAEGALVIDLPDGRTRTIHAGDIFLL